MAAGDLNLLKSWNPKLMKNRKKVWETEQELLKEEQKFKERQKELEKEYEENELINGNNSTKKKSGLEWMYDDKYNKDEENQDYLLGKKKLDANLINKQSKEESIDEQPSTLTPVTKPKFDYSNDDPMSKFNKMAKLNKKKNKISKKKKTKTVTKKIIPDKSFDY